MHSGNKWRSAVWLNARHCGKKRIRTLFYIFFLNPVYVAVYYIIYIIIVEFCGILELCTLKPFYLDLSFQFMFYANSLVNPVLYAVGMT